MKYRINYKSITILRQRSFRRQQRGAGTLKREIRINSGEHLSQLINLPAGV